MGVEGGRGEGGVFSLKILARRGGGVFSTITSMCAF